jgi:nucleotide-binding universal stress UspA family protein
MKKIKKLLVPVDFSICSMHALRYAASLLKYGIESITLLHVAEIKGAPHTRVCSDKLTEVMRENAKMDCMKMISEISVEYGRLPAIDCVVLDNDIPAQAISRYAGRNRYDMVLMGTTGAGGLKEVIIGSVTASVMRKIKVPLLAIPVDYCIDNVDNILFLTNHFEEDKELLTGVVTLAELFSATVHVAVFICREKVQAAEYIYDYRQMCHYIGNLQKSFPNISFKEVLLEGTDFEETVEEFDKVNGVDIIAVMAYRKSFLQRMLQKSQTRKMVLHTRTPLLIIPVQ